MMFLPNPSHAETPLYKGIPDENVRDDVENTLFYYPKPLVSK